MDFIGKYFEFKMVFYQKNSNSLSIHGSQLEDILFYVDEKIQELIKYNDDLYYLKEMLGKARVQDSDNENFWRYEERCLENFKEFISINLAQFEDIYRKLFNIYLTF